MERMRLYRAACRLVARDPFTLDNARALERLEARAEGEERLLIATLWVGLLERGDEGLTRYIHREEN
ncbi:hypothetical protein [Aeromonas schubertii]|uniref:Uncharacterized protein n=2 Tax=Aeromonas schubertii TaxID=652 RepID=A0ABS7V6M7_9GAMM|nr:hypothetical protein [Aeromonas schubertii]KUE81426.1 hypothetical protein ATO46_00310 [Aeromonas schubertii]MBZ6065034.1 hypothetical protein [Aeromonas schubertii]MBZ6073598.1 hypothetical protein [Aeromonas schubertii]QCG48404.1 hypothetical protein E2P79_11605 [Aeromonas schubertii]